MGKLTVLKESSGVGCVTMVKGLYGCGGMWQRGAGTRWRVSNAVEGAAGGEVAVVVDVVGCGRWDELTEDN